MILCSVSHVLSVHGKEGYYREMEYLIPPFDGEMYNSIKQHQNVGKFIDFVVIMEQRRISQNTNDS